MSDIVLFIDPRLKSYESFWDGEWAGNLHELVKKTPLVDAFDDLLVAWKGAADVHGQPWLTMETMKAFAKGLTEGYEPFAIRYVKMVSDCIRNKVHLESKKWRQIRTALNVMLQDMKVVNARSTKPEFSAKEFWDTRLANNREFGLVLAASQRMCYSALYFGYEHFLVDTYKLRLGKEKYRFPNARDFGTDLVSAFSKSVCDVCWNEPAIVVARLARNALAHAGGRETKELQKKRPHGLVVEKGKVFILPGHSKALFDLLKERITGFTTEAIKRLPKS